MFVPKVSRVETFTSLCSVKCYINKIYINKFTPRSTGNMSDGVELHILLKHAVKELWNKLNPQTGDIAL